MGMDSGNKDFRGKDLRGRSFKGQDLAGADFSDAKLGGVDFSGADLTGAKFCRAVMGHSPKGKLKLWGSQLLIGSIFGMMMGIGLQILIIIMETFLVSIIFERNWYLIKMMAFFSLIMSFFIWMAAQRKHSGSIFWFNFFLIAFMITGAIEGPQISAERCHIFSAPLFIEGTPGATAEEKAKAIEMAEEKAEAQARDKLLKPEAIARAVAATIALAIGIALTGTGAVASSGASALAAITAMAVAALAAAGGAILLELVQAIKLPVDPTLQFMATKMIRILSLTVSTSRVIATVAISGAITATIVAARTRTGAAVLAVAVSGTVAGTMAAAELQAIMLAILENFAAAHKLLEPDHVWVSMTDNPALVAVVVAVPIVIFLLLGKYLNRRAILRNEPELSLLRRWHLFANSFGATKFTGRICCADFSGANLRHVCFTHAVLLDCTLTDTIIENGDVE